MAERVLKLCVLGALRGDKSLDFPAFILLPPASASMFPVPPHVRIVAERSVELGEESLEIGKKMLGKQDETIDAIEGVSEKIDRSKEGIVKGISSLRFDFFCVHLR